MYARVSTFSIHPPSIDEAIREFERVSLPQLRQLQGFKGTTMLVNRQRGAFQVLAFYDSLQSIEETAEATKTLRSQIAQKLGAELTSLDVWEVAVDVYPEAGQAQPVSAASGQTW